MGSFPLYSVANYQGKLPKRTVEEGGVLMPMYQREAMWISFKSHSKFAIEIYVGGINALSLEPKDQDLTTLLHNYVSHAKLVRASWLHPDQVGKVPLKSIQDYVVTPEQKWLDGIATDYGRVRQFLATPLKSGYSVEAQITADEIHGCLQFVIIPSVQPPQPIVNAGPIANAKPPVESVEIRALNGKKFHIGGLSGTTTVDELKALIQNAGNIHPNQQRLLYDGKRIEDGVALKHYGIPDQGVIHLDLLRFLEGTPRPPEWEMGINAEALLEQSILKDTYPASIWDQDRIISFNLQILNSDMFRQVTGQDLPPTPITPQTYAANNLPFFECFSDPSDIELDLEGVQFVKAVDMEKSGRDAKATNKEESGREGKEEGVKHDAANHNESNHSEPPNQEPLPSNPLIPLNPSGRALLFHPLPELNLSLTQQTGYQHPSDNWQRKQQHGRLACAADISDQIMHVLPEGYQVEPIEGEEVISEDEELLEFEASLLR